MLLDKNNIIIPDWAKSIIVADFYEDKSDIQSDHFSASVVDTVYLAFSKNTRNNMGELKKASLKFHPTKEFVFCLKNPEEGITNIIEHNSGHYILPNYFLGIGYRYKLD